MSALLVSSRRIAISLLSERSSYLSKTNTFLSTLDGANKFLKVFADTKNLRLGKTIHAQLIIRDQASRTGDVFQINSLINLYVKCSQLPLARKLFDTMPERNIVSWSSLMTGYLHSGFPLEVLRLFGSLVFAGDTRPNEYVVTVVFGSCSNCGRVQEGRQCHGYVLKSGLAFHQFVRNALIYMYAKCSYIKEAITVLNSLPSCDVLAYNSVLSGLLEHGCLREGVEVLQRMVGEDMWWDNVTYVSVLGLCAGLKDLKLGLLVHGRILTTGVECDNLLGGGIINMYGKCGKPPYAQKVFDNLQIRNVICWTSIISAYFQNSCFEEALNLFTRMELDGVKPNEYTFAVLLNATAELSILKHGGLLHGRVVKSGFFNNVIVGNALINMYSESGSFEAANKIFSSMVFRDTISWNSMICGYSHHGLGKEALLLFNDMLAAGECPNYITFIGVLQACSHLGLVDEGLYYLNQLMKQFGVQPGIKHYTCIVGLLSKAGLFDDAEKFMCSTSVRWDAVAWRTLLNACYVRRNYSLGRRVAEFIIEKDPHDAGNYILLSNMYAKSNQWDGVAKIRSLMRQRNVKKEPGVSWIEIKNRTHVFVSEDNNHPDISQIYGKVREILAEIRPLGYVPDVAEVCHDVENEQKEDNLGYHSEKLAVAYGLMKTPPESPLHVFKNLRICDDCHSAMKLISAVSKRRIIIRDANRFHHFHDGKCSCADYW